MNHREAELFRSLLIEACDHYIEIEGGKIVAGAFQTLDGDQCPITCLCGRVVIPDAVKEINSMLGTTSFKIDDLWSFIGAFDNDCANWYPNRVSARLIGKELRQRYISTVK
jgi:hypothetical protein